MPAATAEARSEAANKAWRTRRAKSQPNRCESDGRARLVGLPRTTSYELTLIDHHESGLHAFEPHPACPVCDRHRVDGTCAVDQIDLFTSIDAVASVKDQAEDWLGTEDIRVSLGEVETELDLIEGKAGDAIATINTLRQGLIDTLPDDVRAVLCENEVFQDMLSDIHSDLISLQGSRSDAAGLVDAARKATTETEEQTGKFVALATEAVEAIDKVTP